ncbi:hypothetical protein Bca4012_097086 [Brassica carinata]
MFVCGRGGEDFDYVVDIDANITMNKEQERSLKFVYRELKLDVVDRVVTQTLNIFKTSHLLLQNPGQNESAPLPGEPHRTMDSELNIVVDELGEAAVVRARHSPPP